MKTAVAPKDAARKPCCCARQVETGATVGFGRGDGADSVAHDVRLRSASVRAGERTLLRDVELDVETGAKVALIGPSGAGKTTLLRLIAAAIWPSAGYAKVLGCRTDKLRGRDLRCLRTHVGFLYQHDNLIPGLRVVHNVLMGRLGKWSLPAALWSLLWPREAARAHAALSRVELGDRLWAMPSELSGGEQQRVAIARLLVQEPHLVLADEPQSSLDMRLGRDVVRLLLGIAAERRTTLIVSLHAIDLLGEGFDRVIALRDGAIAWQGTPRQLTRERLRSTYGAEFRTLHLDEVPLAGSTEA